jgi:hypothetical protein
MLFERRLRDGLADGSITVALRRWKRPQVLAGRRYRSPDGLVEVTAVEVVDVVTEELSRAAGFRSVAEALADLGDGDAPVTVVHLHRVDDADPRDVLADDVVIDDVPALRRKVERSLPHLELIAANPGVRAPDLAAQLGMETLVFKRQVRRLKELGLTHSLRVGYRLSPRGEALREAIQQGGPDGP